MDFSFTKEQNAFREDIRAFLREKITDDVIARANRMSDGPYVSEEIKQIFIKHGWFVPHWPQELGGRDLGPIEFAILFEETGYYRVYPGGIHSIAESIRALGTKEQKEFFLQRYARGEIDFTLGISEPNAGVDAANIQIRAELKGDEFVINGQKMWGGRGNPGYAKNNWHWLICRTDPDLPRHRGLSMVMVPLTSSGITIRPLHVMGSVEHLEDTPIDTVCAIYYDNVRVPRSNLLGGLNRGWYQLMAGLDSLRAMIATGYLGESRRVLDDLTGYLKQQRGTGRVADRSQAMRHRVAELRAEVETLRHLCYHLAALEEAKGKSEPLIPVSHLASMSKLASALAVQRSSEFAVQAQGIYGTLCRSEASKWLDSKDEIQRLTRWDRVLTIGAGSAEALRMQISQRYLGLPK